jgi:hypothetical protein
MFRADGPFMLLLKPRRGVYRDCGEVATTVGKNKGRSPGKYCNNGF